MTAKELKANYSQAIFDFFGYGTEGKLYTALEPDDHAHGDAHPSMSRKNNILRDMVTGESYDIFDVIELKEGITSFPEKVRRAAEIAGVTMETESATDRYVWGVISRANGDVATHCKLTEYKYHDIDGNYQFSVWRGDYCRQDGTRSKGFMMGEVDAKGYVRRSTKTGSKAMYGDYTHWTPGTQIFLTEGEKCVDACHKIGLLPVVTVGSCKQWHKKAQILAPDFEGMDVVILQDNDKAGDDASQSIIRAFTAARSVRVLVPCRDFVGSDVADTSLTAEEIQQMIDSAEPVDIPKSGPVKKEAPEQVTSDPENLSRFHLYSDNGRVTGAFHAAIAEDIKARMDVIVISGLPYVYADGVYKPDMRGAKLKTEIKRHIFPKFQRAATIDQVYKLLIDDYDLQVMMDDTNKQPSSWICFTDCYLDARTMETHGHDPQYLTTNQIPLAWSDIRSATAGDEVEQFLNFAIPDQADREMMLQFAGYAMTADTSMQKFLILLGEGGSGKSTLINLIQSMTGLDNVSAVALQDLSQRFATSQLVNRLLNVCADIPGEALADAATLKKCLGEDAIMSEFKGKDAFLFRSRAKMLFSANQFPAIQAERSVAVFRRLLILPMNATPEEPDAGLFKRLCPQIPYFAKLAVSAVNRMYQAGRIAESPNSKQAVAQARRDSDVVQAFVDERCAKDGKARISRDTLFDEFETFCEDEDRKPLTKNGFFRAMRTKRFIETKSGAVRYFQGVRMKTDKEETEFVPADDGEIPFS